MVEQMVTTRREHSAIAPPHQPVKLQQCVCVIVLYSLSSFEYCVLHQNMFRNVNVRIVGKKTTVHVKLQIKLMLHSFIMRVKTFT